MTGLDIFFVERTLLLLSAKKSYQEIKQVYYWRFSVKTFKITNIYSSQLSKAFSNVSKLDSLAWVWKEIVKILDVILFVKYHWKV